MLNMVTKLFARKAVSPRPMPVVDDMPTHAGFMVTVWRDGFKVDKRRFATLKEAQVFLMQRRAMDSRIDAAWYPKSKPGNRRAYSIRNMETGKFAPYLWQLTRAEIAA